LRFPNPDALLSEVSNAESHKRALSSSTVDSMDQLFAQTDALLAREPSNREGKQKVESLDLFSPPSPSKWKPEEEEEEEVEAEPVIKQKAVIPLFNSPPALRPRKKGKK
jgi:hypothetical protein